MKEIRSGEWGTQLDVRGWASPQGPARERWRQALGLSEARGGQGGGMTQVGREWRMGAGEGEGEGECTPQAHAFRRHMHLTCQCTPQAHAPCKQGGVHNDGNCNNKGVCEAV